MNHLSATGSASATDVDILTASETLQTKFERFVSGGLSNDAVVGVQFGGGFEGERIELAGPAELFGRQLVWRLSPFLFFAGHGEILRGEV